MKVLIEFDFEGALVLPVQYNEIIQGFIYRNIDESLAGWLHNHGVKYEKRRFKFFTFSRLMGKYKLKKEKIEFFPPVELQIASINKDIIESLVNNLLKKETHRLSENICQVSKIEVKKPPEYSREKTVKAISPITIYSTLMTKDGRKKTYYYSPFEADWEKQIAMNLIRKAKALGINAKPSEVSIKPIKVGKKDLKLLIYKGTVIKAWMGVYLISLPKALFEIAFDAGIGAKNSQGFGMIEAIE